MSGTSANAAYRNLLRRLYALRKRQIAARVLYGAGLTLCCALGCFFVLLLLETALYLTPAVKVAVVGVVGLFLAFLAVLYCFRPLLLPPSPEDVALQVEHAFGGLHQRLISALQLWSPERRVDHSARLVDAAVIQADEALARLNLDPLVARIQPLRTAVLCGALGIAILVAFAILPEPLTAAAAGLPDRPPPTPVRLRRLSRSIPGAPKSSPASRSQLPRRSPVSCPSRPGSTCGKMTPGRSSSFRCATGGSNTGFPPLPVHFSTDFRRTTR